ELDDHWANVPHPSAFVALAWQGLLRDLPPDGPVAHRAPRPRPLFARADLGGVSREDLRAGGGEMEELLPHAGQELVLTAGEGGALHMRRLERGFQVRRVPAVPARRIGDLVGAGDAFLTALVAARVRWPGDGSGSTGRALHLASVVGSLTVEGRGLAGLPDSRAVAERLDELRRARTSGRPSGEANTGD
ncbi:MAG: PfkB family carbohydrate kinase, partial [Candidatus Limnocylindrales bacterium]